MTAVLAAYERELATRGFESDPAQLKGVHALERCAMEWASYANVQKKWWSKAFKAPSIPKGVYLYGGVGRGKSFLMDCFFNSVQVEGKTRLHFHEFMREVHHELNALQGQVNPLSVLGRQMAKRYQLICFDEFHIADITDAMILHRLLVALFENGVGFVTTSNFRPDDLYPDGLHRDRLLPAIDLLNDQLEVVNVDNGVDYRRQTLEQVDLYLSPCDDRSHETMTSTFNKLSTHEPESTVLMIEARPIQALRREGDLVWFDFKALCDGPRSQNDYLEIANRFHTVFLSNVPQMSANMGSQARRFTWLVDVLYDRRIKLVISAQVPAQDLYLEGPLSHEFPRTVSRLREMQSSEFLALEKRVVDTAIV